MYDLQASRAVKTFEAIFDELFKAEYGKSEKVKSLNDLNDTARERIRVTATALTQSTLIAEAISSTLGDIGPAIESIGR